MSAFPQYETIATEMVSTHVLKVTLNRPQAGNSVNTQMGHDLLDLWNRLTADAGEVRCVVLTGAGEKAGGASRLAPNATPCASAWPANATTSCWTCCTENRLITACGEE